MDFVVRTTYVIGYLIGIYFIIQVIFMHTSTLAGFSKDEVLLLYAATLSLWEFIEVTFFGGFKIMMKEDIITGQFDKVLLKPVSPIFLAGFSVPRIESIFSTVTLFGFLIYLMFQQAASLTPLSVLAFFFFWLCGLIIFFFTISSYASTAFYMTRSLQMLRMLQTLADQTFFPPLVFPKTIGLLLFSLIPTAYIAYIPVSFLLGRGKSWMLFVTILALITSYVTQKILWRAGLRRYSSASS